MRKFCLTPTIVHSPKRIAILSCLLLIVSSGIEPVAMAQSASPLSCSQQQQQDAENSVSVVESQAEQAINANKTSSAIALYTQAFRLAAVLSPRFKSELLDRNSESNDVLGTPLMKLIKRSQPSEKERLMNLLSQVLQVTQSLTSGYSFSETKALTHLASLHRSLGQVDRAAAILAEAAQVSTTIQGAEIQTKALAAIAQEYIALGQTTRAEVVLARSLQFAQQIQTQDSNRRSWALQPIASAYAQIGQIDRALQIVPSIPSIYYRSQVQAEVAQQFIKAKQLDQARQFAQKVENPDTQATVLTEVAAAFAQTGQVSVGNQLFSQALQVVRGAINPPDLTLSNLIVKYAQAGQLDAALQAARQLKDPGEKAIAITGIANQYSEAGQLNKATPLIAEALALVQGLAPQVAANFPQTLFERTLDAKQYRAALELVKRFKDDTYNNRWEYLQRLGNEVIKVRQYDLALEIAQAFPLNLSDYKQQILRQLVPIYAQAGQFDKALQIAQMTENSGSLPYRAAALAAIATQYQRVGRTTQADRTFAQAIQDISRLQPSESSTQGWAIISVELTKAGKPEQAKKRLAQAIQAANKDKDPIVVSSTLRTIADQLILAEQLLPALQVAQAMPDERERGWKLSEISTKLIEARQYQQALQVVQTFQLPEARARGLVTIAKAYAQAEQPNQAIVTLTQAFRVAQAIADPESKTIQVKEDLVVEDTEDRASLLEDIALQYAQVGQVERSQQVAQKIQDSRSRNSLLQRLSCYQNR